MSDEPDAATPGKKRPHAKLKRVAHDGGAVDVNEWEMPRLDGLMEDIITPIETALDALQAAMADRWHEIVRTAVAEVLEYAMEDEANVHFPIEWGPESDGMGGPAVTDATLLRISIPIGSDEDPHWEISLADVVDDAISFQRTHDGRFPERANLEALATMFREQAERIEAALAAASPTPSR